MRWCSVIRILPNSPLRKSWKWTTSKGPVLFHCDVHCPFGKGWFATGKNTRYQNTMEHDGPKKTSQQLLHSLLPNEYLQQLSPCVILVNPNCPCVMLKYFFFPWLSRLNAIFLRDRYCGKATAKNRPFCGWFHQLSCACTQGMPNE